MPTHVNLRAPVSRQPAECGEENGFQFAHEFQAGDMATRGVLEQLTEQLAAVGIGAEDLASLEIILAEALNNVTEHAYAGTTGPIILVLCGCADTYKCRISDRGKPMPYGEAPDPDLPDIEPPDILPEGGFGWHIIRCLTSELQYCRDGPWNSLTLVVPMSGAAQS